MHYLPCHGGLRARVRVRVTVRLTGSFALIGRALDKFFTVLVAHGLQVYMRLK